MERPDWNKVMEDCGGALPHDNERIILTRGTARLALAAITEQNGRDYYHNYGAAARELTDVLSRPVPPNREKLANLTRELSQCDSDCETIRGGSCNCGAQLFAKHALAQSILEQ